MFDVVKSIHEAFGIESTLGFVLLMAVFGAAIFGGAAWIVDKSYRRSTKSSAVVTTPAPSRELAGEKYKLVGTVIALGMGTPASQPNDTTVQVVASITNLGQPTVVKNWTLRVKAPNAERIEGVGRFIVPNKPVVLRLASGETRRFSPNDALYNKGIAAPIQTGGEITGLILFDLKNTGQQDVWREGTVVELGFQDATGNSYLASREVNSGGDTPAQYYPGMTPVQVEPPNKPKRPKSKQRF
jgi:hypothetical protein